MSFLKSIWQDLVEKRLWPVAVVLVLALAAVPLLLGRGGSDEAASVPPAAATPAVDPGAAAQRAEVSVDDSTPEPSDRPGALRDPFKPQASATKRASTTASAVPAAASARPQADTTASAPSTGASSGGSSTGGSSSSSSATTTSTTPATPTTTAAKPAAELPTVALRDFRATIRFQPADAPRTAKARQDVARLTAFPSPKAPAALLLGVLEGGRGAAFMLPSGVTARGEGTCRPSKRKCQVVELGAGETEYLDLAGADGQVTAQYVLELVRIDARRLATVAAARAAHARRSADGTKLLRSAVKAGASATDAYAYDYDAGVVSRVPAKEAKAANRSAASTRTVTTTVTVPAPAPEAATTTTPAGLTWP